MRRHNKRPYGSIAVAHKVGISLRQLYYWVDTLQVVRPRLRRHGTRKFHRFTSQDLKKLKEMKQRVKRGYTLQAALVRVKGKR